MSAIDANRLLVLNVFVNALFPYNELTDNVLISAIDANRLLVLILLNSALPSTSNVLCITVFSASSINVLAIIVIICEGSAGGGTIVLIESVNVDKLIIDDRLLIIDEITISILLTAPCLTKLAGGE